MGATGGPDESQNFHYSIVDPSVAVRMKIVEAKNANGIKTRRVDPAR